MHAVLLSQTTSFTRIGAGVYHVRAYGVNRTLCGKPLTKAPPIGKAIQAINALGDVLCTACRAQIGDQVQVS